MSGHESIMRFIGIRPTIALLEQWRVSTPLDIDRIPHHKGVLGDHVQAAGPSLGRWLYHLREHLTQRCFPAHNLAIRAKELHILRKLRHQAWPVATREGGHVFYFFAAYRIHTT